MTRTQNLLNSIFRQYELRVDWKQFRQVVAPILPGDNGIASYAAQSSPYHLSKCPINDATNALLSRLRDTAAPSFVQWAKVYWAMSNPFSRTLRSPPESPSPILAGLGMLSYEDVKKGTENSQRQCLIAAAGSRRREMRTRFLQEDIPTVAVLTDALVAAMQAGDKRS
ncbi:hypothetical protein J3458_011629 [Metarhizium acridum]|uniref:uncharacterized protein n=1 Tax=Metarhizium acridum TaxID=92637 RepID=UPI001C6CD02C|nr:hypothetical protein J3458_011629 [Metarhizium acridum]